MSDNKKKKKQYTLPELFVMTDMEGVLLLETSQGGDPSGGLQLHDENDTPDGLKNPWGQGDFL